jgi:hypothetical protein
MNLSFSHIICFAVTVLLAGCGTSENKPENGSAPLISLVEHRQEKKVDVLVDGKLFTALRWPDGVYKPVLYPLISSGGSIVTRGFPLEPRDGESSDHRHQIGNWLNYGNVNGSDFWGNGHSGKRSANGGEIKLVEIERKSQGEGEASFVTKSNWIDSAGHELLSEKTEYHFIAADSLRIIDRITTLTATSNEPVTFNDTKEGMFGIRVTRHLELPDGKKVTPDSNAPDPRTGNYRSSEGIAGASVWSTRGRWMNLYGTIGDEKISLVVCDHPQNISYPTYWHARGYGLFAANPLGVKDFTKGGEALNHKLSKGESLTFRYRTIIASGEHLTDEQINSYADDFAKRY